MKLFIIIAALAAGVFAENFGSTMTGPPIAPKTFSEKVDSANAEGRVYITEDIDIYQSVVGVRFSDSVLTAYKSREEGGDYCLLSNPPICPLPTTVRTREIYKARDGKIVLIRTDTARVEPAYTVPEKTVWP